MRSKKKYLIDGRFLNSMTTGIDRYAYQLLACLDKICKGLDIAILVPANAKEIPAYKNIRVIVKKRTRFWTQLVFGPYARLHGRIPVNLCNEASVLAPKGIVCLHDVCYAESEKMYPFLTEFPKEERDWFLKIYQRICKKADRLVTVSEFSKQRIHVLLGVPDEKIAVIGNGWQHFNGVTPDMRIFEQYPQLKRKKFFFTLTSVNRNKNLDWVLKAAENNPQAQFAAAGRKLDSAVDFSQYPNVTYVADVLDCEIKALMQEAKAFIFPSFYEGFGIPPLEAMSVGTPVIVSHAASLPEIFGTAAHYIEPDNPRVDIEKLLAQPVSEKEPVLARYSWEKSAEQLLSLLKEN